MSAHEMMRQRKEIEWTEQVRLEAANRLELADAECIAAEKASDRALNAFWDTEQKLVDARLAYNRAEAIDGDVDAAIYLLEGARGELDRAKKMLAEADWTFAKATRAKREAENDLHAAKSAAAEAVFAWRLA